MAPFHHLGVRAETAGRKPIDLAEARGLSACTAWWLSRTKTRIPSPFTVDNPYLPIVHNHTTICSDASVNGSYGAVYCNKAIWGSIPGAQTNCSSTAAESYATLGGLKAFIHLIKGDMVQLVTDSTSNAVAINKGTSAKDDLKTHVHEMHQLSAIHHKLIIGTFTPRQSNEISDSIRKATTLEDARRNVASLCSRYGLEAIVVDEDS